jgi:transposase
MNITTIGIDLAKNTFSLHGTNEHGKACWRKTVSRKKLLATLANLPPCLVGLEACSGAHYWAREIGKLGHDARIMAPKFVIPYRKGGKNDNNDAAAICEAVARPDMRFVPVKSAEQQAVLALHRVRQGLIQHRTALVNQLRGLLTEFGLVIPKGRYQTHEYIPAILEDAENDLPDLVRRLIHDVWQRYRVACEQVLETDRTLSALVRESAQAQRLMTIPGVGEQVATAIVASVEPGQFDNGRQLAAWIGLTPRQYTTGGVIRLGRITKRGDKYLRMCLIHGARAVIANLRDKQDRTSCWIRDMIARRGYKRAIVALAARNARLIWTLMVKQEDYRAMPVSV